MKYNIIEITPSEYKCGTVLCSQIYSIEGEGKLAIVGEKADPRELGIKDRVGKNELVIIIEEDIIKRLYKKTGLKRIHPK